MSTEEMKEKEQVVEEVQADEMPETRTQEFMDRP